MNRVIKYGKNFYSLCDLYNKKKSNQKEIVLLNGGSRSGKTYEALLFMVGLALKKKELTIVNLISQTADKAEVELYNKLKIICADNKIPYEKNDTKKRLIIYDTIISCKSIDRPDKAQGVESDFVLLDEGNLLNNGTELYSQLEMRTSEMVIVTRNPSNIKDWTDDLIRIPANNQLSEERKSLSILYNVVNSTWKDNVNLKPSVKAGILKYEDTPYNRKMGTVDEWRWSVYGLGVSMKREGCIYPYWNELKEFPTDATFLAFGHDFTNGGEDPHAVIEVHVNEQRKELYFKEIYYKNHFRIEDTANELKEMYVDANSQLDIETLKQFLNKYKIEYDEYSSKDDLLEILYQRDIKLTYNSQIGDSAVPLTLEEYKHHGFDMYGVKKYAGSILDGINLVKNYKLFVVGKDGENINLKEELNNYAWKTLTSGERVFNAPEDKWNHLLDALRYVIMEYLRQL